MTMKKIFFILSIFLTLIATAFPAEFYECVDRDGNTFITDNPPQDVKCKSNDADQEDADRQKKDGEDRPAASDNLDKASKDEVKRLISIPRPGY